MHKGKIGFFNGVLGELSAEMAMCVSVFGEKDYAAGFFVEPVHDIYLVLKKSRQLRMQVIFLHVAFRDAGQSGRLIDRDNVVVLE